jgi:hypothetical protein
MKASVALVGALLVGCSLLAPRGPTEVARGEYYAAGKPAYDSFFIQLHELQVALLAAPDEPQLARSNLAKAVGLPAVASDESLGSRLRDELKKLEAQGLRARLEVPDSFAADASATLYTNEHPAPSRLRTTVPEEATRLVRSRNKMQQTRERLEKLHVTGIELEANVDRDFRVEGPWKREEVRRNLADGQKLIILMQARAREVQDSNDKLLALVSSSVTTDPNLGKIAIDAPPPADEVKAPRRAAARPARPGSVRPASDSAKPPPTPAKPAGAQPPSDAESAPKPVQGNAPAEIEP